MNIVGSTEVNLEILDSNYVFAHRGYDFPGGGTERCNQLWRVNSDYFIERHQVILLE